MSPTSPRSSEEPAGQMSGREKFTLMGMFLLLILLIGAVVSSMTIFGGTSKTTENEGSAVDRPTPTDLPEPDDLLAASPEGDEEDPPLVAPPAPAPEPLTVEFRQQMQAALQSVEDGTAAIGGTAFDYLVDYVRRVSPEELAESADVALAEELHPNGNPAVMAPEVLASYRDLWARSRGKVVELSGRIMDVVEWKLPAAIGDIDRLYQVFFLHRGAWFTVYCLHWNVAENEREALVRGVFFKYGKRDLAGGGEVFGPVLVAKGFGAGAIPLDADRARERRAFEQVRDLTATWKGPAAYALLERWRTLEAEEIDALVRPGLLDVVNLPQSKDREGVRDRDLAAILEAKGEIWKEERGSVLSVTGDLRSTWEIDLPSGAVGGLEKVWFGQVREVGSRRVVTFATCEIGDFEKGQIVTLRGSFLKIYRYPTRDGKLYHSTFVVGRNLISGVDHPVFRAEDRDRYLEAVQDRTAKIQSDSYYYLLWWLATQESAEAIEEAADPDLGRNLVISQYGVLSREDLERYRERWEEARGRPMSVVGRLIYLRPEEIPPGKMPEGFPVQQVYSGTLVTTDRQIYAFTTLDPGEVQPDQGVRVHGLFFKEWRYQNRQNNYSDTLYLLSHRPVAIDPSTDAGWLWPVAMLMAGLSFVLLVIVVSGFRQGRRTTPNARRRAGRRIPSRKGSSDPKAEEVAPTDETGSGQTG